MTLEFVERNFHRVASPEEFGAMERCVASYQREHCAVYGQFAEAGRHLPVAAFKHAPVVTFPAEEAERVFESSGTGRGPRSRHWVRRLAVYERAVSVHFEQVFGPGPHTILAHLPRYQEASSLVYMMDLLIRRHGDEHSGFFLEDTSMPERAVREGGSVLLFGAAFGLLDLVDEGAFTLPREARIIETGGMKTYRRQMTRAGLHRRLAEGFGLPADGIWSEYGMCELLSQAYTRGGAVFYPPAWMRFRVLDPFTLDECAEGVPGALAVFDLANLYSVSALLTEDLAVQRGEGFEILGRLPQSELRGCNFLVESAQA